MAIVPALLSLYNFSVLFHDLSLPLPPSSLIEIAYLQSHSEDEQGCITTRQKQRTEKQLVFPGCQKSLVGSCLWANRQCTEMSLVLVLLYYVRTSFARLGFSLLAKVLYLLIFQGLVSSCVKATGE